MQNEIKKINPILLTDDITQNQYICQFRLCIRLSEQILLANWLGFLSLTAFPTPRWMVKQLMGEGRNSVVISQTLDASWSSMQTMNITSRPRWFYRCILSERERAQEDSSLNCGEVVNSYFQKTFWIRRSFCKESRISNGIGFKYSWGTESSMALDSWFLGQLAFVWKKHWSMLSKEW